MMIPECTCGHNAADHNVDDEELRECQQCDCVQYVDAAKWRQDTMDAALASPLVPLGLTLEQIAEVGQTYALLTADTPAGYRDVVQAIADCRTHRTAVEKRRKELVADAVAHQRRVNASAKTITAALEEIEDPLKAKKQAADEAKAAARAEEERQKLEALEAVVRAQREAEEQRLAAERAVEEQRLAEERERQRIEAERLEAERAKLEAERRETQRVIAEAKRIADEKLAQERAEIERMTAETLKIIEMERAEERNAEFERERIERVRRAEEQARIAAERAELEAERQRLEKLERERIAAEEAAEAKRQAELYEIERQARLAATAPDREKLAAWAQEIRACVISYPDITDEELRCATLSVSGWLEKLADEVEEAIR